MGNLKQKLTEEEWEKIENKEIINKFCNINKNFKNCDTHKINMLGCFDCKMYKRCEK